jgi:hypothetical protein
MTWLEGATLGIAVAGAVLGIVNTCHQLGRDRPKLRVVPLWGMFTIGPDLSSTRLAIEVVNLSAFPLTVQDVGFLRGKFKGKRIALIVPIILDGKPWPRRLEPHDSVTVWCPEGIENSAEMQEARRAYAKTTSGVVRYGTSPAFISYINQRKQEA